MTECRAAAAAGAGSCISSSGGASLNTEKGQNGSSSFALSFAAAGAFSGTTGSAAFRASAPFLALASRHACLSWASFCLCALACHQKECLAKSSQRSMAHCSILNFLPDILCKPKRKGEKTPRSSMPHRLG